MFLVVTTTTPQKTKNPDLSRGLIQQSIFYYSGTHIKFAEDPTPTTQSELSAL